MNRWKESQISTGLVRVRPSQMSFRSDTQPPYVKKPPNFLNIHPPKRHHGTFPYTFKGVPKRSIPGPGIAAKNKSRSLRAIDPFPRFPISQPDDLDHQHQSHLLSHLARKAARTPLAPPLCIPCRCFLRLSCDQNLKPPM